MVTVASQFYRTGVRCRRASNGAQGVALCRPRAHQKSGQRGPDGGAIRVRCVEDIPIPESCFVQNTLRRVSVLSSVTFLSLLAACGGLQRDFGPIGYGWPVQCGEVRQQYRDRVAESEAYTPPGAPEGARHLAVSVGADAISETAAALVEDYERRANRRLADFDLGDEGHDARLDLDAGDVRLVEIDGTAAIEIAVSGALEFMAGVDESGRPLRAFALSARLVLALGIEDDGGAADIVIVPSASAFHDLSFEDALPASDGESGSSGTSGRLDNMVQEGIRGLLQEHVRVVRMLRVDPIALGETGVTLMPVEVRAFASTQEIIVTFRTNLPVDVSQNPANLLGDGDVALWVDEAALSALLLQLTESIGGRAVDRKGRPGGDIRAFINSAETGDGTITLVQEGYNLGFPCSWTLTRMVASFEIDGDDLTVTVHELTPIAASRQQWLVNLMVPDEDVIAGNMSNQLGENVAPPAITITGDTEIRLRLTDILPNPGGVVVRAVVSASSEPDGSGEAEGTSEGDVDADGNPEEDGEEEGDVDADGNPAEDREEEGDVDADGNAPDEGESEGSG